MEGLWVQALAWCARLLGVAAVEECDAGGAAAEGESEFVDQVCCLVRVWVVGDAHCGEVCGDATEEVVLA